MSLKKNKFKKMVAVFMVLNLLLGFSSFLIPGTARATEDVVFTVEINGVETASYTLSDLKAMPVTTKKYGSTGFYERKGVDFIYLLESLEIDHQNWPIELIMLDAPAGYTLNFSYVTEPLLAYEESTGGSDFIPFLPLKLYYGDGSNHKLVYQNVVGINVIKPETLAPPVLAADNTDNTVGNPIELTFADDEAWRAAITDVLVNDSVVASDKYTVMAGKLTIDASVFTAVGDYDIVVKATGYDDATVTQTIDEATEPTVFTVEINGVETASYTLSDLKAMPVTTKKYGSTGFYERKGVDFIYLLESLEIDHQNWPIKLIMLDAPAGYTLNFSYVTEPLLAYEESTGGSDFIPFLPLKLYYGDGSNHKLVYQNVVGINVIKPETLAPPVLAADNTDNTVGNPIELTFADDEAWRAAITDVLVNDSVVASDKYTVTAGKLTIDASVFTAVGDYDIVVKATGYDDATVMQQIMAQQGEVPPVLTPSDQGNTVGNPIVIRYTDSYPPKWEPKITAVLVDGVELEPWQYMIGYGKLTIAGGVFNEVKDYTVTVKATGYQDATVTQTIEPGPELFVSEGKGNMVCVAGKKEHTVAVKNDGTVWAWGDGQSGRLGDGTTGRDNWRSVPGQVSNLTEIMAVAVGENHTLALKSDGTVWAWGSNSSGQLGDGSNMAKTVPVQVLSDSETGNALSGIQAIAVGVDHSLALKSDGTVWAWGKNNYGQLGNGEKGFSAKSTIPVQVLTDLETKTALTDIQAIAAGNEHSLALKSDGTVWAWGRNYYGQLGVGQDRSSLAESTVAVQVLEDPELGVPLTDVKAIAAGQGHSFALKNDGTVWGWGWNGNAQLGNGSTKDSSVPVKVARLTDIQSISAGANHVMAIKDDGTVWVWGDNYYGQLGLEVDATSYIPTQLYTGSDIAMINAGYYYSLAIKNDGTVWAWGENKNGKLGDGTTERSPYPSKKNLPTQVKLAPQVVVPAVESAILGDAVELEFTDDTAWRESIAAVSVDDSDLTGDQYTVTAGKITIAADVFTEPKEYTITIKAAGFLDAVVTQQVQSQPLYDIELLEDDAYEIGETEDGIKTMTVKENQTGLKYFAVSIESIVAHEGTETVVFTHLKDDVQRQLNALEADFDEISTAKAGFNVKPGDVIKVYIVDKLTNDSDSNPIILQ